MAPLNKRARAFLNSTKPVVFKTPKGATKLGSAGYDNARDDIEKTKSLREGTITKTPVNSLDIVNKLYLDDNYYSIADDKYLLNSGDTATGTMFFDGVTGGLGIDVLQSAQIGIHLIVGNNITVGGYILPATDNDLRIGSATKYFQIVYGERIYCDRLVAKNGSRMRITSDDLYFYDNRHLQFGTGRDSSLSYDGANTIWDLQRVGTGDLIIQNGNVKIGPDKPTAREGGKVLEIESPTGAELILSRNDSEVATDDLAGALIFKSNDDTGPTPHYSGIKTLFTGTGGGMQMRFYSGRDNWDNDNPTLIMDNTKNIIIPGGDFYFEGAGTGLPYGAFYGNNIGWTSTAFGGGGAFIIVNTLTASANLNLTTFQNTQELLITKTGKYLVTWSLSVEANGADKHAEAGLGINGTANIEGRQHIHLSSSNKEDSMSGTAILSLTATNTLSLMITNIDDNTQLTVEHVNLSAVMVGG